MLQSTRSQRVRHNLATEQQQHRYSAAFPSGAAFCKTAQSRDRHWEQSTNLIHVSPFQLSSFMCVCVLSSLPCYHQDRLIQLQISKDFGQFQYYKGPGVVPPPTLIPANHHSVSISKILSFQKCYINGIIEDIALQDWLFFFPTHHHSLQTYPSCRV